MKRKLKLGICGDAIGWKYLIYLNLVKLQQATARGDSEEIERLPADLGGAIESKLKVCP
jgi:hypothetical protein